MTKLRLHKTLRFHILGNKGDNEKCQKEDSNDQPCTKITREPPSTKELSFFLDINEPYTRKVIQAALRKRAPNCSVTLGPGEGDDALPLPSGCDFQWSEYERIDWSAVLAGKHGASSYCVRKGLSRKAQLAHYTKLHIAKDPGSLLKDALPMTVIIDTWPVWEEDYGGGAQAGFADVIVGSASSDRGTGRRDRLEKCLEEAKRVMHAEEELFEKELESNPNTDPPTWILKPSTVNKGQGIQIVHLHEQLIDICWTECNIREWVLQRYVSPPLLLRKRKFHIRAYAVALDAIRVYLSKQSLALCSGTNYTPGDTTNTFAHITNTAYQDLDPNFAEADCVRLWNDEDVGTLLVKDGTCLTHKEACERVNRVILDMEEITGEVFRAYKNEFGVFAPIDKCFEHYGLDFVVTANWKVFLLELNPGPDFKQTGNRLSAVIENLMCDTIDAALLIDPKDSSHKRIGCLKLVYENQRKPQSPDGGISMRLT